MLGHMIQLALFYKYLLYLEHLIYNVKNFQLFTLWIIFFPKSIGTFLLLETDIKNNGKPGNFWKRCL